MNIEPGGIEIPQWHIDLVTERINKAKENPALLLNWEEIQYLLDAKEINDDVDNEKIPGNE